MSLADVRHRAERALRSTALAAILVLAATIFIAFQWQDADWSILRTAHLGWLVVAGASYGAGLLALAGTVAAGTSASVWPAVLEAQLHKYIPGSVWQAQPLIAVAGIRLAARFGGAILLTAVLAIAAGVDGWVSVAAGVLLATLLALAAWKLGIRYAFGALKWSLATVLLLVGSGAAVAVALGTEPAGAGRAVAAAWGWGVIAIPVPSGIGVREATLTLMLAEEGAAVATAHRLVTLVVDVLAGAGAIAWRRSRH